MKSPITFILGATPNPERYSFMATALLVEKGHAVYPFGIKKGEILSTPIINEWPTNERIDTVTLVLVAITTIRRNPVIVLLHKYRNTYIKFQDPY